jgi:hypothetical protein
MGCTKVVGSGITSPAHLTGRPSYSSPKRVGSKVLARVCLMDANPLFVQTATLAAKIFPSQSRQRGKACMTDVRSVTASVQNLVFSPSHSLRASSSPMKPPNPNPNYRYIHYVQPTGTSSDAPSRRDLITRQDTHDDVKDTILEEGPLSRKQASKQAKRASKEPIPRPRIPMMTSKIQF